MKGLIDLTPTHFRWRRYDSPDEDWSQWHQLTAGRCPACCCPAGGIMLGGQPVLCECGAREHAEPAEAMTFWDTDHIRSCQGCDLLPPDVPVEVRYALPQEEEAPWDSRSSNSPTGGSPSSAPSSTSSSSSTPPPRS